MRGFTFHMLFDGLINFVADEKAGVPVAMNVFLLDARTPTWIGTPGPNGSKIFHTPHFAKLVVNHDDVVTSNGQLMPSSDGLFDTWFLNDEELEVRPGKDTVDASSPFTLHRGGGDAADFNGIPQSSDEVSPLCFSATAPSGAGLACRMKIEIGRVSADPSSVTVDPYGMVDYSVISKPDPSGDVDDAMKHAKRIATLGLHERLFLATDDSKPTSVVIASKKFGSKDFVELRPPVTRTLEVILRNSGDTKPDSSFGPKKSFIDIDYELTYRLAHPRPSPVLVPAINPKILSIVTFPDRPCSPRGNGSRPV